ncbi:MAG: cytochrome c oxidase subunit II [Actinobacteria bacterium]|nr:cytochrome c oxidase subunit II [Actinomycetota bacterium]
MRRFPVLFSLVALISLSVLFTSAQAFSFSKAANSPGSKCSKVGAVARSGATQVKCVKSGKKIIWRKVVQVKTPSPATTSTLKPTPAQTQTPTTTTIPAAQNEYEVNAKATQWSYSFSYLIGASKIPLNSASSHSNILYLPQGKLTHILLKSNDVSHGFSIPGLGIDKEASPDATTKIDITPEKTGTFPGACNIQCGRGHAGMIFSIVVVSQADYLNYLATLK